MLSNMGYDSESLEHANRVRGRRQAPRDAMVRSQPTYMTAPFAVQQEPARIAISTAADPTDDIMMDDDDRFLSPVNSQSMIQPLHAPLSQQRLTKNGLNLFSWNTEPPKSLPPRVARERGAEELLRLRPLDSGVQRDLEVLQKFEGNKQGRFLCFSENEPNGRNQKGRESTVNREHHSMGFGGPPNGSLIDQDGGMMMQRGARRSSLEVCENEGIAGFSGMGLGHSRNAAGKGRFGRQGATNAEV